MIFVFSFFWCIQSFKTQLDETWIPFFLFLPYKLTFYCKSFTKYFKKYSNNVAFSDDLEPFEFKHFSHPLAPVMVGSAGDTKLSAFWNMCFSKPSHFGNRGTAPEHSHFLSYLLFIVSSFLWNKFSEIMEEEQRSRFDLIDVEILSCFKKFP